MVDYLSLALTHALMVLAAWRLLMREDLDRDPPLDRRADGTDPGTGEEGPGGGSDPGGSPAVPRLGVPASRTVRSRADGHA